MTTFHFLCPKCFKQNEVEKEVTMAVPVTVKCPFCATVIRVNGSAVALPKGDSFKIDQRYII